jgi:hypothetical protein
MLGRVVQTFKIALYMPVVEHLARLDHNLIEDFGATSVFVFGW